MAIRRCNLVGRQVGPSCIAKPYLDDHLVSYQCFYLECVQGMVHSLMAIKHKVNHIMVDQDIEVAVLGSPAATKDNLVATVGIQAVAKDNQAAMDNQATMGTLATMGILATMGTLAIVTGTLAVVTGIQAVVTGILAVITGIQAVVTGIPFEVIEDIPFMATLVT